MRKYIAATISAVLLLVLCSASVLGGQLGFRDLEPEDPNYPYIVEMAHAGVMVDGGDGVLGIDDPVNRLEVMELLLETIGAGGEPLEEAAVSNRLVYVYDETTLHNPATRLETAQMAARALDLLPMAGESPYTDCDDGYVVKLWEKGIWDSGTRFRPEDAITRGELAALLWRMGRTDLSVDAFQYSGYWVEELDGVPKNPYELTSFALAAEGVTYEDGNYTVLRGIDVSEFQGEINWRAVKASGIDFAILRVGGRLMQSGRIFEDAWFRSNVERATAAGVQVGVYFFSQAINAEEGLEEAEFVLSLIEGYDITMPVVADWEYLDYDDVRIYGVEPDKVTDAVEAFCRRVKEAGYTPMAYMNTYCGYTKLDLRRLDGVDFWFAQYTDAPTFRYHFTMWQYSDQGRVNGISGNVDMNLYFVPKSS